LSTSAYGRTFAVVDGDLETERLHRLRCELCEVSSGLRAVGWEAHLTREEDGSEGVAFFCPECISEFEQR